MMGDREEQDSGIAPDRATDCRMSPPPRRRRVCFFARVVDRNVLESIEFYRTDILLLQELGFDVQIATRFRELRRADLFFVWWWTWAFAPVFVARVLRTPALVTGTFDDWAYPRRPWVHRALIRFAARRAAVNVFVSKLEHQAVASRFALANTSYSPHVVDTDYYRPGDYPRQGFGVTVVQMDRGNARRKALFELIQALPAILSVAPGFSLVVVGVCGSDFPAVRAEVERLEVGNAVTFAGRVSRDRKRELLQSCALYLQPSHFEGFGLAILEAMSCGAPVLTSDAGAVREVGGDAVHYARPMPEDIAAQTLMLLQDANVRDFLGRSSRERAVTMFSNERRREDLRVLIDSITGAG